MQEGKTNIRTNHGFGQLSRQLVSFPARSSNKFYELNPLDLDSQRLLANSGLTDLEFPYILSTVSAECVLRSISEPWHRKQELRGSQ